MKQGEVLERAEFTNALRYWVWQAVLIMAVSIVLIPLIPIVAPIIYLVRRIEYRHIACVLTERTLFVRRGWLNRRESTIPLENITDLAIQQSLLMRWTGVQAISVETAGQSSGGKALVHLVGVAHAEGFRDAVLTRRDELRDRAPRRGPDAPAEPGATGDSDHALLADIRDTLHRIEGVLDEHRNRPD
jgi:putative membrane protein